MAPQYLGQRRHDVRTMRLALEHSDFAAIRGLGHKLSGTGAGYGFPRISEIGAALEAAAKSNDASAIRAQLDALSAICGPDT
jgi:HPt (histidine-containing phosphotransfer) domain-containing protein